MKTIQTIGLIGAGHIGSQLARLAIRSGYSVVISNSRGPETLADLVAELGPRARAAIAVDAGETSRVGVTAAGSTVIVPVMPLPAWTSQ